MVDILTDLEDAGVKLDELENAALGGSIHQTISMRAAIDASKRIWFAELVCKFLSFAIQRDHCADQLNGVSMTLPEYIRALAWLIVLADILALPALILFQLGSLLYGSL